MPPAPLPPAADALQAAMLPPNACTAGSAAASCRARPVSWFGSTDAALARAEQAAVRASRRATDDGEASGRDSASRISTRSCSATKEHVPAGAVTTSHELACSLRTVPAATVCHTPVTFAVTLVFAEGRPPALAAMAVTAVANARESTAKKADQASAAVVGAVESAGAVPATSTCRSNETAMVVDTTVLGGIDGATDRVPEALRVGADTDAERDLEADARVPVGEALREALAFALRVALVPGEVAAAD